MASEYGYSYERILDTPLCSLRQWAENIKVRIKAIRKHQESLVEWQTKVLAQFLAGVAQTPEQAKALGKAASKISLKSGSDDTDDDVSGTSSATPNASNPEVFVEQGSQVAEARNKAGSYERFMRGTRSVEEV